MKLRHGAAAAAAAAATVQSASIGWHIDRHYVPRCSKTFPKERVGAIHCMIPSVLLLTSQAAVQNPCRLS